MRLHIMIQRHICEMIGWLQVVVIVRLTAVVIIYR